MSRRRIEPSIKVGEVCNGDDPLASPHAAWVIRQRELAAAAGLRLWYVAYGSGRMMVVAAKTEADARRQGREEFSVPGTRLNCHEATDGDLAYYRSGGGDLGLDEPKPAPVDRVAELEGHLVVLYELLLQPTEVPRDRLDEVGRDRARDAMREAGRIKGAHE